MHFAKRAGVILMIFGFLASLFGCSAKNDHGAWTSFTVSNLSPDRLASYSFRVNVTDSGEMMLFGYFYEKEKEYRSDEGVTLSSETAEKLRLMEIEKLKPYGTKRGVKVADKTEKKATVDYEDGTECEVKLPENNRAELVTLLGGELVLASLGEFTEFGIYRYSSGTYGSYGFKITRSESGDILLEGYCYDGEDYCSTDEPIVLSDSAAEVIRAISPEKLPSAEEEEEPTDGLSRSAYIVYGDETTRKVDVGDRHLTLEDILSGELVTAVRAKERGQWQKLYFSRSGGDDFSYYFSFGIEPDQNGDLILSGYCHDDNGETLENEDGFALPYETVEALRDLKLEYLAPYCEPEFEDGEEPILLDGDNTTLTLYFEGGISEKKTFSQNVEQTLFDLLQKEFLG